MPNSSSASRSSRRSSRHAGLHRISSARLRSRVPADRSSPFPRTRSNRLASPRRPITASSCRASTSTCRRQALRATISAFRGTRTGPATSTWSTTSTGGSSFLADYQALLGSEFRPFDPYQSNYTARGVGLGPDRQDRARRRPESRLAAPRRSIQASARSRRTRSAGASCGGSAASRHRSNCAPMSGR